ncbi:MFS transporter [Clostridium massiliamazoniense]|uniref:MFS transporter n=1 Tax=Clostridium massiliamazoniense TaxID=1347366 RepID=UPI0006D83249|nr:MFS transporter [Clostridium massiliamazoniense]
MNFALLKNKSFLLLILSNLISLIGTEALNFALSLYVLVITGSAIKFAFLLSISAIPPIIISPISGVLVDRLNKKILIILLNLIDFFVLSINIFIYLENKKISMVGIYVLVILLAITSSIFNPAVSTIIPSIIEEEHLVDANGFNSICKNIALLFAPILSGFLFGIYGLNIILFIDCISFLIAAINFGFIRLPKIENDKFLNLSTFLVEFKEGLDFIKSKKILGVIVILGLIINFAYIPVISVGFNYLGKIVLHITDYQLGILNSISLISIVFSPFLCKFLLKRVELSKIIFIDIFIVSLLLILLSILNNSLVLKLFNRVLIPYLNLLIIAFLLNLISSTGNLALTTIIQKETPISLLGRVGSVFSTILLIAMPLGQMVFGIVFNKYSVSIGFFLAGILILVSTIISGKYLLN